MIIGNRLIVFGFRYATAQLRRSNTGSEFRDEFGRDADRETPSDKSVALLELMGTETNSSPYFQSSALPTELPGLEMWKRVLNSCARSESSPERRFRAPGPIIPGSRRWGFVEGDVEVPGNDAGKSKKRTLRKPR